MNKKVLFLLLAVGLMFAFSLAFGVESAYANNGPHGGYAASTDACAGCHRSHTGTGPNLLVNATTNGLCLTCHGAAGTGSDLNSDDGRERISTNFTNAGGFVNEGGAAVTSVHMDNNLAWGNAVNRGVSAAITDATFDCASCHDPHGSTNYRIIKETVNGTATVVTQVDEGAQVYTAESWPANVSNVCASCHANYHIVAANSGTDLVAAGSEGTYTHRIDMAYNYGGNVNPETVGFGGLNLPLAGADLVACQTCHFSHGSSSAMAGFADGGPTGAGVVPGDTTAADSALLRLDNRGVCETCHQK